jgi:hypothetical protein
VDDTHQVALDRLRTICAALPAVTERVSHGAPSFFVRDKKMFATVSGDWDEVGSIVEDAYRDVAPDRLIAELDER